MQLKIKRMLDLLLCLLMSPLLVPLFLIIALIIKLDGGPVFFNAARVGKHQKHFKAMKFRSMIVNADKYLDETADRSETGSPGLENGYDGLASTSCHRLSMC